MCKFLTFLLQARNVACGVCIVGIFSLHASSVFAGPALPSMPNHKQLLLNQTDTKTIQGLVQDKNHEPIIGATVIPKDGDGGVVTDANGHFSIKINSEQNKLIFSYMGYSPVEADVTGKTNIEVTLFEDVVSLQDVVVVGYNTVKRGQITGSIDMVKGNRIAQQTSATLEDRLQGKISGLMISTGSGQPGTDDVKIRIRGTGSINGSNTPLYILDGVMIEAGQFSSLNSDDILDIQVLKDASATAIYGSRGANGVIVVTTKKGMEGKTQISYNLKLGAAMLRKPKSRMMTGPENILYQSYCVAQSPNSKSFPLMRLLGLEQKKAAGTITSEELAEFNAGAERLATARSTDTDFIDEMTHTGLQIDHSLTLSGGTEKTKFFLSGSLLNQEGSLI